MAKYPSETHLHLRTNLYLNIGVIRVMILTLLKLSFLLSKIALANGQYVKIIEAIMSYMEVSQTWRSKVGGTSQYARMSSV